MLVTSGLQSILSQSAYNGPPNAGTYATPTIVTGDPTPAATGAWSGTSDTLGMGVGRLSLTMLALILVSLVAFGYWTRTIQA